MEDVLDLEFNRNLLRWGRESRGGSSKCCYDGDSRPHSYLATAPVATLPIVKATFLIAVSHIRRLESLWVHLSSTAPAIAAHRRHLANTAPLSTAGRWGAGCSIRRLESIWVHFCIVHQPRVRCEAGFYGRNWPFALLSGT
jgi:hypothetical protein